MFDYTLRILKKKKKKVFEKERKVNKTGLQTQISDEGLSVSCDQERTHWYKTLDCKILKTDFFKLVIKLFCAIMQHYYY